jgi:type I restriction enzyme S subunit
MNTTPQNTPFKQTEIGPIPQDWEVKRLGDIGEFASGTTPRREMNERYFQNGSIFWVKTMDLNDAEIYDTSEKVTEVALKETSSLKIFPVDTVLVAMYGGYNQIGRTGILKISACVNQALTAVQTNKQILNPLFLINFLNYRVKYWKDVATSSRKDPNITSKDVKDFPVILPPLPEQTAIATALSDADALIGGLEKLIHKKRLLKQATMQHLLTPKEDWEVKKLGEECELITKGTTPTSIGKDFKSSGINFIKIESLTGNGRIIKDKVAFIDIDTNNLLKRSQIKQGDVLFSIAGALGRVALVDDEILPANTNQALAIIRLRKESAIDLKYLYFYLNSKKIQGHILSISVQGAQANLSLLNISELSIEFPLKTEQIEIGETLSDMDAELSGLEGKLEKYRQLKQGMMQQLLTGKIRLV